MRVKTFLKSGNDKNSKTHHSGNAAITITLDREQVQPKIMIEYLGSNEELLTMAGDLLVMLEGNFPGVAKNAIMQYLKATGQLSADGKTAHIQYKNPNRKEDSKNG